MSSRILFLVYSAKAGERRSLSCKIFLTFGAGFLHQFAGVLNIDEAARDDVGRADEFAGAPLKGADDHEHAAVAAASGRARRRAKRRQRPGVDHDVFNGELVVGHDAALGVELD